MMIHLQHHHCHVDHNSSLTDAKAECAPCENRRVDARSASERTGGHDDGGGVFVLVFVLPYLFLYHMFYVYVRLIMMIFTSCYVTTHISNNRMTKKFEARLWMKECSTTPTKSSLLKSQKQFGLKIDR